MPSELSSIQALAEDLAQAISNLPADAYNELSETLNEKTDLNLGDLQSLLNSANNLLEPEL